MTVACWLLFYQQVAYLYLAVYMQINVNRIMMSTCSMCAGGLSEQTGAV